MKKKRYSEEQIVKILLEAEKQEKPIAVFLSNPVYNMETFCS
jgi:hypothetical protein